MTIRHETEIVHTRREADAMVYAVERDGRRIEARVPVAALDKLGPMPASKMARRTMVARAIEAAVREAE